MSRLPWSWWLACSILPAQAPSVLFVVHSAGFTHEVVKRAEKGRLAFAELQLRRALGDRVQFSSTADVAGLTPDALRAHQVIAFYTTGELPMPAPARAALFEHVDQGAGFVGIHSATDTWYEDARYGALIGGYFDGHPWHQVVQVRVEDPQHPATAHLPETFPIHDEIYQFRDWDRGRLRVLLSVEPGSVDLARGKRKDGDYALAWTRDVGAGRMFYTALGHRPEIWTDGRFMHHLVQGILWAGRLEPQPAARPDDAIVLFGGEEATAWRHRNGDPCRWRVVDGELEVAAGTGDLLTHEAFGDFDLHLEFRLPEQDDAASAERANSGVYLQDRYELQILDSFGHPPGPRECGAIYGDRAPAIQAALPAGRWQRYEIEFRAARYGDDGTRTAPATISLLHNGMRVHDRVEVREPTGGGSVEGPGTAPIRLQDHGQPVRFRNIWLRRR